MRNCKDKLFEFQTADGFNAMKGNVITMEKSKIRTLANLITESAGEYGSNIFIKEIKGGEVAETTFAGFYENVRRVAGYIQKKKAEFGEMPSGKQLHGAVIGPSSSNWLTAWFGLAASGNVAVPLDAGLSCEDICDLLNRADVSIFFYDKLYEKMIPAVKENCPNVREYVCLADIYEVTGECEPIELPKISPSELAAIVYTSGTTGKSKGVMLLQSNYIDNTMCQDNESSPEDVVMSVLPIHHIYCFTCDILCSLRYGANLCFNDSMLHITKNLQVYKPTLMLIVPMIAETIYKQICAAHKTKPEIPVAAIAQNVFGGRLKTIYSGGAYLRPELQRAYLDMGFNMAQGYGMTECSPRISTADPNDKECAGDVGVIVNGAAVKTEDGEIMVKSPSVMAGYYKDEAETAAALTPDGWLRTGDLGYVDDKNRIFITGRKKNLIILSNGENVSPEELENKFAGREIIGEVLVYSDEGIIAAEIFPSPEASKSLSAEEIDEKIKEAVNDVNKSVSSSKKIHRIRVRENEFPKTTSKKIKRNGAPEGRIIG
ncbi:MAG: AMP-binding protein [Oscillospiraceae bacterium]|nr:AMP-binding protein [Oscillospiraceae bacterium]